MTPMAMLKKREAGAPLTERFLSAVRLANDLHGTARRPGTQIPFMAHLLIVSGLVLEEGGDEATVVAALLHDAVEECGDTALASIYEEFGSATAARVLECSDEGGELRSWRERKREHLRHIARVQDEGTMLILLADKVHNVRSIVRDYRVEGDALWRRYQDRSADDQLWYFRELVGVFDSLCGGPLVVDLREGVSELEELLGLR
jgi:(p)ppGpp synthase/HD superfamily hydrolase